MRLRLWAVAAALGFLPFTGRAEEKSSGLMKTFRIDEEPEPAPAPKPAPERKVTFKLEDDADSPPPSRANTFRVDDEPPSKPARKAETKPEAAAPRKTFRIDDEPASKPAPQAEKASVQTPAEAPRKRPEPPRKVELTAADEAEIDEQVMP